MSYPSKHWLDGLESAQLNNTPSSTGGSSNNGNNQTNIDQNAQKNKPFFSKINCPEFYIPSNTNELINLNSHPFKPQLCPENKNPVTSYSNIINGIEGRNIPINEKIPNILSDVDEAFLVRYYIEVVAPTMTVFSVEIAVCFFCLVLFGF